MNPEEIENLKKELESSLDSSAKANKIQLENIRKLIDENIKDVINIYSTEIRNLSIISATIAPFSLTLLSETKFDINQLSLVLGFSVLIFNIILIQLFLNTLSRAQDKKIINADIKWIFAEGDQSLIANTTIDSSERVLKNMDFLEKVQKIYDSLGYGAFNMEIQKIRYKLRKYNNIFITLFSLGSLLIILSVAINPLILAILHLFNNW